MGRHRGHHQSRPAIGQRAAAQLVRFSHEDLPLPSTDFHDITTGGNGTYNAGPGYDLVTGLGTPVANLLVADMVGVGTISGKVFGDTDGSGTLNGGETGLQGWTVYQDFNSNGSFDPVVTNTFTPGVPDVPKTISNGNGATTTSTYIASGVTGNIIDVNVTLSISAATASVTSRSA